MLQNNTILRTSITWPCLTSSSGLISCTALTSATVPLYVTITFGLQLWFIRATLSQKDTQLLSSTSYILAKAVVLISSMRLTLEIQQNPNETALHLQWWSHYNSPGMWKGGISMDTQTWNHPQIGYKVLGQMSCFLKWELLDTVC